MARELKKGAELAKYNEDQIEMFQAEKEKMIAELNSLRKELEEAKKDVRK